MATAPKPATPTGPGPNPKMVKIGGAILLFLLLVLVFGLIFSGGDDGPAWTKDPRFIHNTQQEAWEMK